MGMVDIYQHTRRTFVNTQPLDPPSLESCMGNILRISHETWVFDRYLYQSPVLVVLHIRLGEVIIIRSFVCGPESGIERLHDPTTPALVNVGGS